MMKPNARNEQQHNTPEAGQPPRQGGAAEGGQTSQPKTTGHWLRRTQQNNQERTHEHRE